jgi:hypothetical protein
MISMKMRDDVYSYIGVNGKNNLRHSISDSKI